MNKESDMKKLRYIHIIFKANIYVNVTKGYIISLTPSMKTKSNCCDLAVMYDSMFARMRVDYCDCNVY